MLDQRENRVVSWARVVALSSLGASYWGCTTALRELPRNSHVPDHRPSRGKHGRHGQSRWRRSGAQVATGTGGSLPGAAGNSPGTGGGSSASDSGSPSGGRDAGQGDAADGTGGSLDAGTDAGIPPQSCPTGFLDCNH
jgi:hypothetical protein